MDLVLSDTDSFSESSYSEDQDDIDFVYGGRACSILSSLEETLGKIDDFLSFERGFIHGDIVCSIKDPAGQLGRVVNVDVLVDLENIYGRKIQDVNSKDLKRIRSISVGDYVVSGAWLGKVEKVVDRVTVLLHDGTKCDFTASDLEKLVPTSPDLLEDSQYPFYPGQTVHVKCSSASNSTSWFFGMSKNNGNQGAVCSVDAGLVYVSWLGCTMIGCEKLSAPPCLQDASNLLLLSCFSHANWQLGDWCLVQRNGCKSVKRQNFLAPSCGPIKGQEQSDKVPEEENAGHHFPEVAVIVKKKTKVDVLWQDGSYSKGLDSNSLISISLTDPHDFWPDQFVLEKETFDDSPCPGFHKWGIVRSVDAKERTVKVKWNAVALDQGTNVKLQQTEEIVSAYELIEHPDYSYSFGDAVFRLHNNSLLLYPVDEKACRSLLTGKRDNESGTDLNYSKELMDFSNNDLSPCIGIVVGLKDGSVEVKWVNGVIEKVAPYEIYRIEKCASLSPSMPSTATAELMNEGRPELDQQFPEPREKDKASDKVPNEDVQKKLWDSSSCSLPQAAIGFFTWISSSLSNSLSTSFFGAYKHLSKDEQVENEEAPELCTMCTGDTITDLNTGPAVKEVEKGKGHAEHKSKYHEHFRQFDMVSDCSDHHFVDGIGSGLGASQIRRIWLKRVQQEWNILERDLPETIYVRAYEERMELLRAAIVGPQGTPYHDGLFFFDIFLPQEYPNVPPMVFYNSGGLRVNPNLYESGKVCLSLLNTWTGSGSEVWNPKNSTILQVLLSLQALVLTEKPYFNEAGFDLQIGKVESEKNSISYNENAFIVSCKSMLYLLRKPPKHFEALIEEHFRHHGERILLACKAYMKGSPVGSPIGDEKMDQENNTNGSSMGFKIMLQKLFPRLVEAFSGKGVDCGHLFV